MSEPKKRCRSDNSDSSMSSSVAKRSKSLSKESPETLSIDTVNTNPSNDQNVKVVVRLRPLSAKEREESSTESVQCHPESRSILVDKNRRFQYDAVFGPRATQNEVYEGIAGDMVKTNVFKGFNVTILAYGQTGSGKTFTMGTQGGFGSVGSKGGLSAPTNGDGIIPRAVYDVFQARETMEQGEKRVKVEMSYLEIYNEEARDLLCTDKSGSNLLNIRDGKDGVIVQNLSLAEVRSPNEVSALMESASQRRATGSTAMNAVSSRSHAICTLNITVLPLSSLPEIESYEDGSEDVVIRSKLTLVDLAGSERIKRTGAEGHRMKEGININRGLFVLGQVVSALSEHGQQSQKTPSSVAHTHIPYRDSKLTRLLQDSLGGNSRTVMVANVSPASSNADESINTLRYAERTGNIKNSAVQNVVATTMSVQEAAALRRENQMLKLKLLQAQAKSSALPGTKYRTTSELELSGESESISSVVGVSDENLELLTKLRARNSSLQCKLEQMEDQVRSTGEEFLQATLRADRWELRYNQLTTVVSEKGIDVSSELQSGEDKATLVSQMRKEMVDIQSQLKEAQTDAAVARATAAAVVVGGGDLASVSEIAVSVDEGPDEDDANREMLTSELASMSGKIEQKEAMALQMNKERECMDLLRSHFEGAVSRLQEEVSVLSSEKESLLSKIREESAAPEKVRNNNHDKMRIRIKELESKIGDLKKQSEEHKKTLRLREKAEAKCAKLASEIKEDKRRRAELQRKLKDELRERRSEQKAAKLQASRMLRDRQKLEYELKKVKDTAAKQTAVLRRKNAEALSRQKKTTEQQRKRNVAAAIRSDKNGRAGSTDGVKGRDELLSWLEREIDSSHTLIETTNQIKEHTVLLGELVAHRNDMPSSGNPGNSEDKDRRALDKEIELRRGVVKHLEENMKELRKARGVTNGKGIASSSVSFEDISTWNNLARSEIKYVFTNVFDRLIALKIESERQKVSHQETIAKAVNDAVSKEKRLANDAISKLKLQNSEEVMTLLESTRNAMEHEVRTQFLEANGSGISDQAFQAVVDEMFGSYLKGCTSVGEKVQKDLQDIKIQQDGMKRMVDDAVKDFIVNNEVGAPSKSKKKAKKSSKRSPDVDDDYFLDDDDDIPFEDSDDSDWNPETPAKRMRKEEKTISKGVSTMKMGVSKEITTLETRLEETCEDEYGKPLNKLTVAELRKILRKRGLVVSGKKAELLMRLKDSRSSPKNARTSEEHCSVGTSENPRPNSGGGARTALQTVAVAESNARESSVNTDERNGSDSKENTPPASQDSSRGIVVTKGHRRPLATKPLTTSVSNVRASRVREKRITFEKPLKAEGANTSSSPPRVTSATTFTASAKKRRRRSMANDITKMIMEAEKIHRGTK